MKFRPAGSNRPNQAFIALGRAKNSPDEWLSPTEYEQLLHDGCWIWLRCRLKGDGDTVEDFIPEEEAFFCS
jgi:hypothetical protein